jgi:hypothetical protein
VRSRRTSATAHGGPRARRADASGSVDVPVVTANLRRARCACCALPTDVRADMARRARSGESLRSITEHVVNLGYGLGRGAVTEHLRRCVGIEQPEAQPVELRSVSIAHTVAAELVRAPHSARRIAERLAEQGMPDEAEILMHSVPERMRSTLTEPGTSPGAELLAGRLLAQAVGAVLSPLSHHGGARPRARAGPARRTSPCRRPPLLGGAFRHLRPGRGGGPVSSGRACSGHLRRAHGWRARPLTSREHQEEA